MSRWPSSKRSRSVASGRRRAPPADLHDVGRLGSTRSDRRGCASQRAVGAFARGLQRSGTRSAFDPDGPVAGSERLERFYLWPMGIASPGQMRQWGRHATAFVGRRHFDHPTLIDRYFERLP